MALGSLEWDGGGTKGGIRADCVASEGKGKE
jgi:hypothetical protein